MNGSNWSLEKYFLNKWTGVGYPIKDVRGGIESGVSVFLHVFEDNLESQHKGTDQRFKVNLNVPGDALKQSTNFYLVSFGEDVVISIKPTITITSEGLRKYHPNQRQCLLFGELYEMGMCMR